MTVLIQVVMPNFCCNTVKKETWKGKMYQTVIINIVIIQVWREVKNNSLEKRKHVV